MASKSKKRRRVFRASCILAALIIAGSSFAWFTSKDEVTNRLSANADYGVSIVESFAPPANWIPGQEVNKDVYAVNTGNVDAFVKETVSGVLTITTEKATDTFSKDCVELTEAERYVMEDGSYLAYAPETSNLKKGDKVVAMNPDKTNLDGYTASSDKNFAPDAEGLYVFRRSIGVDPETKVETFKYEGYYYVPGLGETKKDVPLQETEGDHEGKYRWVNVAEGATENDFAWTDDPDTPPTAVEGKEYQLVTESVTDNPEIKGKYYKISDLTVTPDGVLDRAGDGVYTDGNLEDATAGWYVEETKTVVPTLKYEAKNDDHPNRLVAIYDTGSKVTNGNLEQLALELDNAKVAYEDAIEEYKAALRDDDNADTAVFNANQALQNALDALRARQNELDDAEAALLAANKTLEEKEAALTAANEAKEAAEAADSTAQDNVDAALVAFNAATAAYDAQNTIVGQKQAAKAEADQNLTNAEDSARDAFIAYLKTLPDFKYDNSDDNEEAKPYVISDAINPLVTYDVLNGLDVQNSGMGENEYKYYRLLVAQKEAERDLAAETEVLEGLEADKNFKEQQYNDAVDAKGKTAQKLADATTAAEKAQQERDTAYDDVNDSDNGKQALRDAALAARDAARDEVNNKRAEYDAAVLASDNEDPKGTSQKLKDAADHLTAAATDLAKAEEKFNNAYDASNGKLKININLSDDVVTAGGTADKWQLLPAALDDMYDNATTLEDQDGIKDTASFYYTSILGAGETTSKLIDSVELDSSVTNDVYKRFDFDLNVALQSSQIAYDADGNVTADAVNTEFTGANVTDVNEATNVVTWTSTTPAAAAADSYKVATATFNPGNGDASEAMTDVTINKESPAVQVGSNTYRYSITKDTKKYFGNELEAGKEFIEGTYNSETETYSAGNGKITLNSNATPNT